MKTETLGDTLGNVVAKTLVDIGDETLPEVEQKHLRNTLANVMTEAQINALADTLAEVENKTINGTLRHLLSEAQVHTTLDTLREKRLKQIPTYCAMKREVEVQAEALLDALAHTLAEMSPRTLATVKGEQNCQRTRVCRHSQRSTR